MKILVAGGAGYIGSHTVKELTADGHNVVVYDDLRKGHQQAISGVQFVKAPLEDATVIEETLKKNDIEAVIHFAADIEVGESMVDPEKFYRNNVGNTLNLLGAMKNAGVRHIVFSSTAAVYGNPKSVPITEEAEKAPTSVYGRTKLMVEQILADYAAAYNMTYTALRYFNAAGAHISGEIGEAHNPESHLIPIILQVLLGQRDELKIFGDDYPTKDGTCVRDYIHVTDLARAHVLAVEALVNGAESDVFNLGNGNGFTILEVIRTVEKITGKKIPFNNAPRRSGDPAELIAGSQKVRTKLGWKPQYDSLETIVETAWKWHSKNPTGFAP